MAQQFLLVWLDSNAEDQSEHCQNMIVQFRHVINTVKTFADSGQCIHFLQALKEENVFIVASGALGQQIVPRIHGISQIDSIFIFCNNKNYHEQWAKDWPKIKGVFIQIKLVCEALKLAVQQCEYNAVPISIINASDALSKKELDQLDPCFMYTQIMKEILFSIEFEQEHIVQFVEYCREQLSGNERDLRYANHLEKHYRHKTPIWWYTSECFLYSMVNRALRTMDADLIIKLGFFIKDLHCQIEQLHKEQFSDHSDAKSFSVYRGQGIDREAFEKMTVTKGGLVSFNFFLSTSRKPDIAQEFAKRSSTSADVVAVIFVITINPTKFTTPFASIANFAVNEHRHEDEILFSMHSVFRIGNITSTNKEQPFCQVELTLTNDDDKDLRQLTNHIQKETFPNSIGWYRWGQVLLKIGQPAKAEQVYQILLEQTTDKNEKARIYHQLGAIKDELGQYKEALDYYKQDLEISENSLPKNDSNLVISYNNIGNAHACMDNYSEALEAYQKALAIEKRSSSSESLELAACHNNIGNVYSRMNDGVQALSSHEKAHAILQKFLPPNHPHLATSYFNIGLLYEQVGNSAKALLSYERAVDIGKRALPPNHRDLQDYQKKLADIKKKFLDNNH